ncbi:PaaI family thioesterase [Dongia deserti]|uniref:PaaI family thioesterase n=1 Tax=Dongia deserti TaxID=2268030 RepID=UPI000E651C64|nr:PaaI family thioesterase [Dongia deserti]
MNLFAEIGTHLSGLDRLRTMMKDGRLTGIERTLALRLIEVEEGRVVVEGTPSLQVYNPFGVVHGGYAASILDNACGYAAQSMMAPGQMCTTLELKVAYHKAMTEETGPVRAEGKIVSIGRRAAFTEARLTDIAGKLYASATSSLIVMSS